MMSSCKGFINTWTKEAKAIHFKHWLLAGIVCAVFWPIAALAQDALWKAYIAILYRTLL